MGTPSLHDRLLLLLILSEHSISSEWVKTELAKARKREVRASFIPDFSYWKDHDSYQAGFQRLVSDLKAESSKS